MRVPDILLLSLLVLLVVLACFVDNTEASRKRKKGKAGVCKYERKGEEGPCDPASNTKVITIPLKKGDPATCQANKTVTKTCSDNSLTRRKKMKGCKYEKKGSDWGECDPATKEKSRVMKLRDASNPQCPPTHTKTKKCGAGKRKGSRNSRKDA